LCLAIPAWAQAPAPATKPMVVPEKTMDREKSMVDKAAVPQKKCADCGVVTSIKSVKKELPPADSTDSQPSGLVASVPFGGGKAQIGSSAKRDGKDSVIMSETWQVTVRLDD